MNRLSRLGNSRRVSAGNLAGPRHRADAPEHIGRCAGVFPMKMRGLIIFNPAAGQRGDHLLKRVVTRLEAGGMEVTLLAPRSAGELERIVRDASSTDWDCVIVAGGDGSLKEAMNGRSVNNPPLGLIPTGTANVVALELGLPKSPDALADVILQGRTAQISLAEANGRQFVFTAGVGFDAYLISTVSSRLKKRFGRLAFAIAALRDFMRYRFPMFDIVVDGRTYHGAGVLIMNGSLYAGPYAAAPDRKLTDPDFSVIVLRNPGVRAAASYMFALAKGKLSTHADVDFIASANSVDVTGPEGTIFQADGDNAGILPLRARSGADQAQLIVPPLQAMAAAGL